jgi:Protein of unknown function (DUF3024)
VVTGLEPKLNREPTTYRCSLGDKAASSPQRNTADGTAYVKHSAATARHWLGILRRVFDYAIRDGVIQRNPAAGIRLPKVQDNDPRPLTHDALWRLAGQFEGTRDRLLVLVAGYCGLRWGHADAASACVAGTVLGCDHDRMAAGGLPELDVARVQRWCADQVPEHARGEIRVECDVTPRHLTICECRPPWHEHLGPDWTRFPIARLHYTKTTRLWTLYWRDRNLKYHRYEPLDPSPQVQDLLDYLDDRADPIFWG